MRHRQHILLHGRYVLRALQRHQRGGWIARIRDVATGRVSSRWSNAERQDVARQEIIDWIDDIARRAGACVGGDISFEAAVEEFLRLRVCRATTARYYAATARQGLLPYLQGMPLRSITYADVERIQHAGHQAGLSPRTVSMRVSMLRSIFRWARRRGYVERDPTDGIRLGGARAVGRALTVDEARQLLAHVAHRSVVSCADSRRQPWIQARPMRDRLFLGLVLALYTGIRQRTLHTLRWRDVDLERMRIDLPADALKSGRPLSLPIHPQLERVLRAELARLPVIDLDATVLQHRSQLNQTLTRAIRDCGLQHLRWHDLRHTYASWLAERVPHAVLQALLGHASQSVTDRYLHVRWPQLVEGIATLPDVLPGCDLREIFKRRKISP